MSGASNPPDNSVQLEQMKEDQATAAQARQDKIDADNKASLAALRDAAIGGAKSSANDYFTQQGADPSQYSSTIDDLINQIAATVPSDSATPGTAFQDIGQQAYDQAQTGARTQATNSLSDLFPSNFEYTRIPDNIDQPTIDAIDAEQRQTAEQYLNNLLSRGVVTDSGYTAAESDLNRQDAGVRAQLSELGQASEATGRQSLTDITNRANQDANNLRLGQTFDPYGYKTNVDDAFNTWLQNLGGDIRGKVTGNLFDTSGLPVIAGAAQGAGNQPFDPTALAGITQTQDEKDKQDQQNRLATSTGVF